MTPTRVRLALFAACVLALPAAVGGQTAAVEQQTSGTTQLLQAVSPVDSSVVWISGHGGTFVRTVDGGRTWRAGVVPGTDSLEFRDVQALSADEAWLLSAGPGDKSRIYHTTDAGRSWQLQWTNAEPTGFYDCMAFWDARRGVVYGDAVDGELRVLRTEDAGKTWTLVPGTKLPKALPNEGGFAASGTCVTTAAGGRGWMGAGNATRARSFRTDDYGETWTASDVPLVAGEAAGVTSISMLDESTWTAFGGNLNSKEHTDDVARTTDGGRTWRKLPHLALAGAAYGGAHIQGTGVRGLVAVGPGGADVSTDGGQTWTTVDPGAWWGVGSIGRNATWIAGPQGRIARIRLP